YCSTSAFMKKDFPDPDGPKVNLDRLLTRPVRMGRSDGSIATGRPCLSVKRIRKSESSSVCRDSLKRRQTAASEVVRNQSYFLSSTPPPGNAVLNSSN